MAILKDFIDQVTFPEVWAVLGEGRDNMTEYEDAYRGIFEELKAAEPQENQDNMTIRFVMEEGFEWNFIFDEDAEDEEEDEGEVLQVYGFVPGDEEGYAIGLKSPAILVGLFVHEETVRDYTPVEIVANCMAEMTYSATMAQSAYGTEKEMAGGGLLASQVCMSEDIQDVDLNALRESLGIIPQQEDYKTKYGFLF